MSIRVLVTGIGLVSALGKNKQQNWQRLLNGETGISNQLINFSHLPLGKICLDSNFSNSPLLFKETPTQVLTEIPKVELWLKQAVTEALADAQLAIPLPNCAVVVGSSRGYQAELELILDQKTNHLSHKPIFPFLFPGFLSQAIATQIQTKSITLATMAACATGNLAIAQGYELIQLGKAEMVLVGASDSVLTPLGIAGFKQIGALAKTGLYPFSHEREGLVLGEGAAALILESETAWRSHSQTKVYGEILGFGITNDAAHLTSPSSEGAERAINKCLESAQLLPDQIDLISTHGTGTLINDQMEADLIQTLFSNHPIAIATKGATAHILGATSLIEAAFCLMALSEQQVPPTVGLRNAQFRLNLSQISQKVQLTNALNFSFGFGGQNVITALGAIGSSNQI